VPTILFSNLARFSKPDFPETTRKCDP
jgi:hypothetical protein